MGDKIFEVQGPEGEWWERFLADSPAEAVEKYAEWRDKQGDYPYCGDKCREPIGVRREGQAEVEWFQIEVELIPQYRAVKAKGGLDGTDKSG